MFAWKNYLYTFDAFFNASLVLTYAIPKASLQLLVPDFMHLGLFNDEWAFLEVEVLDTRQIRPRGFPTFTSNDFITIAFRVLVEYVKTDDKKFRGLYTLKSETNKSGLAFWGNVLNTYRFTATDLRIYKDEKNMSVFSYRSGLEIEATIDEHAIPLPPSSPFKDVEEAMEFTGSFPYIFIHDPDTKETLIIEGVRKNWKPRPVEIVQEHIEFIEEMDIRDVRLASAFLVENVPVVWKKGKKDIRKDE